MKAQHKAGMHPKHTLCWDLSKFLW